MAIKKHTSTTLKMNKIQQINKHLQTARRAPTSQPQPLCKAARVIEGGGYIIACLIDFIQKIYAGKAAYVLLLGQKIKYCPK